VADRWFSPGTSVFTSNKTTGEGWGVLKVKIGYGAATGVWKTTYSYIRSTKTIPFIYYSVIGAPITFRLQYKIKHTYINYAPTDPNDITEILLKLIGWFGFMVLNATFNNISAISWRLVLLVEETGVSVIDKLYHILLYTSPWAGFELTTSVVLGTNCIGSCKSHYHTITVATSPVEIEIKNS
jgi:hypothetical protein